MRSTVRQITKLGVPALVLGMLLGCAGRDLDIICREANAIEKDISIGPETAPSEFVRRVDKKISYFGAIRSAFDEMAASRLDTRYVLFLGAARKAGYPEWECPAAQRLILAKQY